MRRFITILIGCLVGSLLVAMVTLARQRPPTSPAPARKPEQQSGQTDQISIRERFNTTVSLRAKDGRSLPIRAVLRDWSIRGGEPVKEFPEQGLLIVQLRAGRVATVINGQRQERNEDEIWTVPANARMSVELLGETAVLQTMAIKTSP